jgi:hypothetical protein
MQESFGNLCAEVSQRADTGTGRLREASRCWLREVTGNQEAARREEAGSAYQAAGEGTCQAAGETLAAHLDGLGPIGPFAVPPSLSVTPPYGSTTGMCSYSLSYTAFIAAS